jgi:hypothetical protein
MPADSPSTPPSVLKQAIKAVLAVKYALGLGGSISNLCAARLHHLWQAARWKDNRKSANLPMYHGSRGKFSEVDTEGLAITMLREWRRRAQ